MPKISFELTDLARIWPEVLTMPTLPRKKKKRLKREITHRIRTIINDLIAEQHG